MKKLLIALLVIAAVYVIGAAVFAVANGQADGKIVSSQKQLLTDGDMEASDTSAWTALSGGVLTKESGAKDDGAQILRIFDSGSTGAASQTILTAGKEYRVTGWGRGDGGTGIVRIGTQYTFFWLGTNSTEWQRIDFVFTSDDTDLVLYMFGTNGYVEFDDILVTDYIGPTTNAEDQLIVDGDMEASDTSAWTVGNSATLTKEVGAAEDGDRIIRVAYGGGGNAAARQNGIMIVGEDYRISGWARSDGTGVPKVYIGSSPETLIFSGTVSTDWQYFDGIGSPNLIGRISLYNFSGEASYSEFDDITVTEYTAPMTDNELQLLADGDMEEADTSSWLTTYNPTLTKESGGAEDGDRFLRVAYNDTSNPYARQTILTSGKTYHLTGFYKAGSGGYCRITNVAQYVGPMSNSSEWTRVDFVFTAVNATIGLMNWASAGYCDFDDFVISEFRP